MCAANHRQLLNEQLPERARQLFDDYGPAGEAPILPESQGRHSLRARSVDISVEQLPSDSSDGSYVALYISNSHGQAVDLSGWQLRGDVPYVFVAGQVLPTNSTIQISPIADLADGSRYMFLGTPRQAPDQQFEFMNNRGAGVRVAVVQGAHRPCAAVQGTNKLRARYHHGPDWRLVLVEKKSGLVLKNITTPLLCCYG